MAHSTGNVRSRAAGNHACRRIGRPGDLDPSFGTGGTAYADFGSGTENYARDAAVDPISGDIVMVGASETGPEESSAAIARFTPSGKLDTGFGGGDGIVSLHFGDDFDLARAVAIDASGRIVVAGLSNLVFALARLTSSGKLDTTFGGGDGIVTRSTCFGGMGNVLIDQEERIVVGCTESDEFTLIRFTSSGELDTTFGGGGIVMTSFDGVGSSRILSIALDTEDRLVAIGSVGPASSNNLAVARYLENGALDTSYSGDGRATAPLGKEVILTDAALDSHNRIVAAGDFFEEGQPFHYVLARFTPSGRPDPTFAADGVHIGEPDSLASALVVDPQDRILIAGHTSALPGYEDGLSRFRPDGSLDPTFGGGSGIAPMSDQIVEALAVNASQGILAAGSDYVAKSVDFAVARFEGGGSPPPAQHTITIETAGTGSGSIESTPLGIDCGAQCAAEFGEGEVVTLSAEPVGNSEFGGWTSVSGDPGTCTGTASPCEVTVGEYTELEASFDKGPVSEYTLTINKSGSGTGSVSSSPSGIDCGSTCSHGFEEGTEVTLTATAPTGSIFTGWSGACSGSGDCAATINADTAVTATFNAQPSSGGGESGSPAGSGSSTTPTPPGTPTTALGKVTINGVARTATFRFSGQGGPALTFQCKLDRGPFKPCRSPKTYRKLKPGPHVFRVRAQDALGQTDTTPGSKRFRIPKS